MNSTLDISIFYFFNHLPHPHVLNTVASILHKITSGGQLYYAIIILLVIFGNTILRQVALVWFISIAVASIITNVLLKPLTHRLRPYDTLAHVYAIMPLPHTFSFPSGEAAGAWATAVCLVLIAPTIFSKNKTLFFSVILFLYAILISVERIYMGHHYPTDVLVGALVGACTAYTIILNQKYIFKFLKFVKTFFM